MHTQSSPERQRQGSTSWPPALPGEPPIPPPDRWVVIVDGSQGRTGGAR